MDHPYFINAPNPPNKLIKSYWLFTAKKILANHDLVSNKSFAISAYESDPTLAATADQILLSMIS